MKAPMPHLSSVPHHYLTRPNLEHNKLNNKHRNKSRAEIALGREHGRAKGVKGIPPLSHTLRSELVLSPSKSTARGDLALFSPSQYMCVSVS